MENTDNAAAATAIVKIRVIFMVFYLSFTCLMTEG